MTRILSIAALALAFVFGCHGRARAGQVQGHRQGSHGHGPERHRAHQEGRPREGLRRLRQPQGRLRRPRPVHRRVRPEGQGPRPRRQREDDRQGPDRPSRRGRQVLREGARRDDVQVARCQGLAGLQVHESRRPARSSRSRCSSSASRTSSSAAASTRAKAPRPEANPWSCARYESVPASPSGFGAILAILMVVLRRQHVARQEEPRRPRARFTRPPAPSSRSRAR